MGFEEDNLTGQVLRLIDERSSISTLDLAKELQIDHQRIVGSIKSIESQTAITTSEFLVVEQRELRRTELTEEGKLVAEHGSHEARVFNAIPADTGIAQQQLMGAFGDSTVGKVGFSKAMSNGWILLDKNTRLVKRKVPTINDQLHALTSSLKELTLENQGLDEKILSELKKRKLINDTVVKYMLVSKGKNFSRTIEHPETDLTASLIQSGEWRNKQFKPYNYNALGVPVSCGHLHPLLQVREQFHQIFLEMGFAEMPTNNFVESSFWNFDVLFVPQAHPARDSQDTFFIKHPQKCDKMPDKQFIERVRQSHFGSGSICWPMGYQYNWNQDESSKNVLRTHTTAVTARMLYQLAQDYHQDTNPNKLFKPAKLFSIDRVFRNETLDATHLAEFNQVEGVVVDVGLTLGDLMGILKAFFTKLGIKRLRFKPAYNPYTEPSMEVFSYHEGLKKWVEVGNSGVFRPEMLHCLGLPKDVTAIAWGLSLERPTMIKYKIDNIRHLVGHKIDLQMVHNSSICMF